MKKEKYKEIHLKKGEIATITPDMIIGDVIIAYPEAIPAMQEMGMHCVGCFIAMHETIEEGALVHGLDPKKICKKINETIKKTKNYAEILLTQKMGPKLETLTYELPRGENYAVGQIIEVPLRKKSTKGIIYRVHQNKPKYKTRKITKIVKNAPHLEEWQVELLKWIADYYFCPLSKALKLFLPTPFIKKKSIQRSTTITEPQQFEIKFKHTLNPEQKKAIKTIKESERDVSLVHGITGSGKTEIYMHIVEESLKKGEQVLILIPEISLSPQMSDRFEKHFHEKAVTIHSQLTLRQKEEAWKSIHKNEAKIVIGSRSALFAPFKNLGYIIIDEEHDSCYKQEQSPRYNAIDVAKKMAEMLNIKILLGSATPSLESYYQAEQGNYELIELTKRPTTKNLKLPITKIVDLREEIKKKNFSIFSEILQADLRQMLENKEQIILFLNRRGAASAVICRTCGYTSNCPSCEIPLTYHKKISVEEGTYPAERLVCHHCGYITKVPTLCPNCGSAFIKYIGIGTQRVEEEINKLYPLAKVIRADRDTTQKRNQFEKIYEMFKKGEADILVGTQMIAIGLHLPNVNLVGVILADTGLTIPNFRSSERTFQIITQVAGRAGREKQGEVIIQTYLPNHYAIKTAAAQDYHSFYKKEISLRKEMKNPPFTKLIKLTIKDRNHDKCLQKTLKLFKKLEKFNEEFGCTLNYYPALIPRLNNVYRWHILINGDEPAELLKEVSGDLGEVIVDVDPMSTV
jgi:primosomal protein N' (replication factor Y)